MGVLAFLLKHWKPLALALLVAGVWFHGDRNGAGRVQTRWEAERNNASRLALEETARIEAERAADVAAKDDRIRTLETEHEAEREKNRVAAAVAERGYNDRLRRIASSCHNRVVPSGGDAPGVSEAIAAERDRLRERIGRSIARLGEAGNELALRDKLCVRAWAER